MKLSEKELYGAIVIICLAFLINTWLSWGLIGCINIAGMLFLTFLLVILGKWKETDRGVLGVFGIAGLSVSIGFSFS